MIFISAEPAPQGFIFSLGREHVPLNAFTSQVLADFKQTAAIRPSSRFLVNGMLRGLPLKRALRVVELGPGTGVFTRQLLDQMPGEGRLLAFEINENFSGYLRENLPDLRLEIVTKCAASAGGELRRRGWNRVDVVISSLGFGCMPDEKGHEIFAGLTPFMDKDSVLSQFQYAHQIKYLSGRLSRFNISDLLAEHFRRIDRRMVWRNVPPAFVFHCRV